MNGRTAAIKFKNNNGLTKNSHYHLRNQTAKHISVACIKDQYNKTEYLCTTMILDTFYALLSARIVSFRKVIIIIKDPGHGTKNFCTRYFFSLGTRK